MWLWRGVLNEQRAPKTLGGVGREDLCPPDLPAERFSQIKMASHSFPKLMKALSA